MNTIPFQKKALVGIMAGLGLTFALVVPAQAAVKPPTPEEMWAIIQAQQKEIEALKTEQKTTKQKVETTDQKVEATSKSVEQAAQAVEQATQKTASRSSWADKTKIGGYGEIHYNNINLDSGGNFNQINFSRFVLLFGHEFTDKIRFFSELEVENAVVSSDSGDPGEVEVEQGYVDFDINSYATARAGLFLVPVGILNETHEPTTFYGVERNIVEAQIIPTTWREGGAGVRGQFGSGWSYDAAFTSGLKVPTDAGNSDAFRIRRGRQELAEAVANDPAYTGRLKWTGIPGVELAATFQYQNDLTQGVGPAGTSSSATLFETHAVVNKGPFGLRALYARWDLNGDSANFATGADGAGRDQQTGWYIEPSFKITPKIGIFARYSEADNRAGSNGPSDSKLKQANAGFNYWPYEDVVLKFDYQNQSGGEGGGLEPGDGFNLGIGYQF